MSAVNKSQLKPHAIRAVYRDWFDRQTDEDLAILLVAAMSSDKALCDSIRELCCSQETVPEGVSGIEVSFDGKSSVLAREGVVAMLLQNKMAPSLVLLKGGSDG